MSGVINKNHFQNLQQKDQVINQLLNQNQALQREIHNRNVYENFVASAIAGALANPSISSEANQADGAADRYIKMVALLAVGSADETVRLLNEKQAAFIEAQKIAKKKAEDEKGAEIPEIKAYEGTEPKN